MKNVFSCSILRSSFPSSTALRYSPSHHLPNSIPFLSFKTQLKNNPQARRHTQKEPHKNMKMETEIYKENTNNTINFLFDKERKMRQKIILYPAMLFFCPNKLFWTFQMSNSMAEHLSRGRRSCDLSMAHL